MSIGKVTTWRMTEEERLAYIKKNPIIPMEKPKGVAFSNIHEYGERTKKERFHGKKIIDSVDKDRLHKLFMSGENLEDIASALNVSYANLNSYISQQRKIEPEKWPYRAKNKTHRPG